MFDLVRRLCLFSMLLALTCSFTFAADQSGMACDRFPVVGVQCRQNGTISGEVINYSGRDYVSMTFQIYIYDISGKCIGSHGFKQFGVNDNHSMTFSFSDNKICGKAHYARAVFKEGEVKRNFPPIDSRPQLTRPASP